MIITPEYKALQKTLHQTSEIYGISGQRYTEVARSLSAWGRLAILDYGCGKCTLAKALGPAYRITNYDPCIDGLDTPPEPHDVVICTDVMEHVENEFIKPTLKELRRLTNKVCFLSIALTPAMKTLADGRNAHISLYPKDEWLEMIRNAGFEIIEVMDDEEECTTFGVVCK